MCTVSNERRESRGREGERKKREQKQERAEIRGRKEKGTEEESSGLRKSVEKRDGSTITVTFNFSKRNFSFFTFFVLFKMASLCI